MKMFVIEKSIDGILSALYISFTEKLVPDLVIDNISYQPLIDCLPIEIETNIEHANRVKTALFKYGGCDIIAHLKVCLLSCEKDALLVAFNYAYFMLEKRQDVSNMLAEKKVSDFSFLIQKVLHERHIMLGFLRFKESANGVLYAQCAPDNDIVELLAPHFLRRLSSTPFIIHDGKRNKIAISNGRTIKVQFTDLPANFSPSQNEENFNLLWKKYFRAINIKERKNTAQQDRYFPRRYRKYCFETWE
ncbi:MAG: TIGR03915 family putative DNA repair protein [Clostridia bacterium]|nr:TIGR03915 family putative DNA repair protein [Clostridia bacterium]